MKKIIFGLIGLLFTAKVEAAIYYVSGSGNNSNTCTQAQTLATAKLTFRSAISCASAGDAVYFAAGTYTNSDDFIDSQSFTIPSGSSYNSPITIAAIPGASVTILGQFPIRLTTGSPQYLVIGGLNQSITFDGNSGTATEVAFIDGGSHIKLLYNNFTGGHDFGIHTGPTSTDLEIINNNVYLNGTHGLGTTNGHAIYMTTSSSIIDGNKIYNNQGYGIHIYNNTGSHSIPSNNIVRNNIIHDNGLQNAGTACGITVTWGDNNIVYNNIVYNMTSSGGCGIQAYTSSTNARIWNNTIYNIQSECVYLEFYSTPAPLVQNNIVYTCGVSPAVKDYGGTGTPTIDHNLSTNPSFTNAAAANFTLQAGSAAIDAGTTLSPTMPAVDIMGTVRPQGTAWDEGAYERIQQPVIAPRFSPTKVTALPSSCNEGEMVNLTTGSIGHAVGDLGDHICDNGAWAHLP